MEILDGRSLRDKLLGEYEKKIKDNDLKIRLDIIQVGDNSESNVYIRNKIKYASNIGIKVILHKLDENTTEDNIRVLIEELNNNIEVTGIIMQSPIPKNLDYNYLVEKINPKKDVDGFTSYNIESLYHNRENILPCTVKGVLKLLEYYNIVLDGARVVVIGRGEIVGKPLMLALINRNATVTLCHSHTKDLKSITKNADIIISAVGKKDLIKSDMVKEGFIGIDVGISIEDGKMYGDFDYEDVKTKARALTPTPGGVGPMTVAMIMDNLIEMENRQDGQNIK